MISAKQEVETVQIGPEMVKAWAVEIGSSWAGARVRRIEGADTWVALELFPKGYLIFSWFPESCGCGIVSREIIERLAKLGKRQPPIVLALKSQIMGARLTGAKQINADRVLALHFSRPVGMEVSQARVLILEASPRFSNLILTDGELQVLETECHQRPDDGGPERTRPGFPYLPPPAVSGLSPANWPPQISPDDLGGFRGIGKGLIETLKKAWDFVENPVEGLSRIYGLGERGFSLDSYLPQRAGKALLVFPCILSGAKAVSGSPLEATGSELGTAILERVAGVAARNAGSRFSRETRHLRNRLEGLMRQLAECEQAELWKKYGEALLSYTEGILEGENEVDVPHWGDSGPEMLRVPFDSRLTRVQNAQACFKRYRKGKDIKASVEAEIGKLEREIASLEQDEMLAEALALCGEGIQEKGSRSPGGKKGQKDSGVHRFEIDVFTVLVGTSAKGNRQVTFKMASPEDLWFHVKDLPGAHVVVKTGKRTVPQAVIEKAAEIAAFFSKARTSPHAVVEMTEKRHVRSRQGQNPGEVLYTHSRALTVSPRLPGGDY